MNVYNVLQYNGNLNRPGFTAMPKTMICNIHQTKLTVKKASTFLGYPAQEVFEVEK